jgi:hypothetical protein
MPYFERTGMISQRHPFYGYGSAPTPRASAARVLLKAATGYGDDAAAATTTPTSLLDSISPAVGAYSAGMGALQLYALHYLWGAVPQKRWPFWIAALGLGGLGVTNIVVGAVALGRGL